MPLQSLAFSLWTKGATLAQIAEKSKAGCDRQLSEHTDTQSITACCVRSQNWTMDHFHILTSQRWHQVQSGSPICEGSSHDMQESMPSTDLIPDIIHYTHCVCIMRELELDNIIM